MEWDPVTTYEDGSPIVNLAGYRVFYSTSSFLRNGVYLTVPEAMGAEDVEVLEVSGTESSAVVILPAGVTYHFRVIAVGSDGAMSGFNVDGNGADTEISGMASCRS